MRTVSCFTVLTFAYKSVAPVNYLINVLRADFFTPKKGHWQENHDVLGPGFYGRHLNVLYTPFYQHVNNGEK